jgi:hypothetical protein
MSFKCDFKDLSVDGIKIGAVMNPQKFMWNKMKLAEGNFQLLGFLNYY